MPKHDSQGMQDMRSSAAVSTVTQILRRLGSELTITAQGEGISRSEALARYLWELALTKQVQLSTGEIVKATNGEWLEIVFRIVERMEGKPMQAISADVNHGMVLNRVPRLGSSVAMDSVDTTMSEITAVPGIKKDVIVE